MMSLVDSVTDLASTPLGLPDVLPSAEKNRLRKYYHDVEGSRIKDLACRASSKLEMFDTRAVLRTTLHD
jgi:hypothetical protein